jgi:NAD(P)-dependent dehydrogenase (short-subunit alcohol dehydrogenase family)
VTDFRADGARVLITGGTSGLGETMAAALVDAGAVVARIVAKDFAARLAALLREARQRDDCCRVI